MTLWRAVVLKMSAGTRLVRTPCLLWNQRVHHYGHEPATGSSTESNKSNSYSHPLPVMSFYAFVS